MNECLMRLFTFLLYSKEGIPAIENIFLDYDLLSNLH